MDGVVDRSTYILGPGDMVALSLWGAANEKHYLGVTPDGDLLLPIGGPLAVVGYSIDRAETRVVDSLRPYYQNTRITLSLVRPRTIAVHVVGAVTQPGMAEVSATTRASHVLRRIGQLEEDASLRNIEIRRGDEVLRVDLPRYDFLGDETANPYLVEGDVVYVPFREASVSVNGAVHRVGEFELVEGETLGGLIDLCAGFRPSADLSTIEIQRFLPQDPTASETLMTSAIGPDGDWKDIELRDGDRVFIRDVKNWHRDPRVLVDGEVHHPGPYTIVEGQERLTDVVRRAGGITERVDLDQAILIRGEFTLRTGGPDRYFDRLSEDESGLMSPMDKEFMRSMLREHKSMMPVDFRAMFERGDSSEDILLRDGDAIFFPKILRMVRVSGAVDRPGLYPYESEKEASYYLELAGGYVPNADKRMIRIIRFETGQRVKPRGGMFVEPEDMVWVPEKHAKFWWDNFKDFVTVAASIAMIYLVIDQASQ